MSTATIVCCCVVGAILIILMIVLIFILWRMSNRLGKENLDERDRAYMVRKYLKNRLKDLKRETAKTEGFLEALSNSSGAGAVSDKIRSADSSFDRLKREEIKIANLIGDIDRLF